MHVGVLSQPSNFHAEKWSRALARAGARVTLFTLDRGGLAMSDTTDGVRVVNLRPAVAWGGRYRYPSYYLSAPALRRALAHHGVDVLHPLHLTPFGTWALQTGFRPVVAAAMGADVLEYPPALAHLGPEVRTWRQADPSHNPLLRWQERLRNRFYRTQVHKVIHQSALVTGDNQPLVDAMLDWFGADPAKTRLLRWGLEPELLAHTPALRAAVRAQWGIPPGARVVFSPRGANAVYQADRILAAIARLLPDPAFGGYFFLVLGAGYSLARDVQAMADRLGRDYPTQFRFVPQQIPRHAVYQLWAAVDAFISAPIYDGYSAAIAEGRYVGAIPIVNAIPGNLEIITDGYNGRVVAPFTPDRLVEVLRELDADFDRYRAEFAPRNRAWIEQHSLLSVNAARWLGWAEAVR